MIVRPGTEADIHCLGLLWSDMVHEETPSSTPDIDLWRQLGRDLTRAKLLVTHVAEDAGKIIGWIDFLFIVEPSTGAKIAHGRHAYVKPAYRGMGISGRLYRHSIASALKLGATELRASVMVDGAAFWSHHGFMVAEMVMRKEVGVVGEIVHEVAA